MKMRTLRKARRATGSRIIAAGFGPRELWNPTDEKPPRRLAGNRERNVLAIVNRTLRDLKIACVPASPWNILAVCAGLPADAKTTRIADALETKPLILNECVALMRREMSGEGENYWDASVLMERLRALRIRMQTDEEGR